MTKSQIEHLAEYMNLAPWVISADAAVLWGLDMKTMDEAYLVGRVWNLLKEWKHTEDERHRTINQAHVKEYMKQLGYPSFDTYSENAAYLLTAIYGDHDDDEIVG